MEKEECIATVLNPEYEIFVVCVVFLSSTLLDIDIHPSYRPKIIGLIAKEALTKVFAKYANFANIFFWT